MFVWVSPALASDGEGVGHNFAVTFFWIAIILLAAKISSLVEHFGQPSVLGELVLGVVLGNLALIGIGIFETPKNEPILNFLAELGVVILLFQVGLETNLAQMSRVGLSAAAVAVVGVIAPFALATFVVGPYLLPGLGFNTYLFLGAALTATSVGITARVFRDLGYLKSAEARVVLGAAVLDDILGLIILAVVTAVVTVGVVSLAKVVWIVFKAVAFLIITVGSGLIVAPYVNRLFSKINAGVGMKFTLLVSSGLIFAYLAELIGLAPIVGAFAAGLVLEPLHYRNFKEPEIIDDLRKSLTDAPLPVKTNVFRVIEAHSRHHAEELVEPVAHLFVPIFFVMTGMAVRLEVLFESPVVLLLALGVTVVAVIGKLVAGLAASGGIDKIVIGWSMVPRGEVGLIFVSIGKSIGVISDELFSVIVIMVIITTLITPPILTYLLKRRPVLAVAAPTTGEDEMNLDDTTQILWQVFEAHFGQWSTRMLKKLKIRAIHWITPSKR
jgi:Kef-type K+ transport system membrane component KefB